jgi:thioredoxin-related protein
LLLVISFSLTLSAQTIDFNQINKEASAQHKTVLVFFHTEHCPYCNKMIKEQFGNPTIRPNIDKEFYFVDIKLDDEDKIIYKDFKGTASKFADFFHIQFYPTILFMENNVVVSNIKGYRNKDKFGVILKYIASKSYESMDLETFINELEMKD